VGGPLSTSLRRHEQRLALGVAAAAALVLGAAPLVALLAEVAAGWPQALAVLGNAPPLALLLRSLAIALAVTALALAGGIPLGVLVGRTDARGRGLALLLHAFPVFLPPFLLALGWFQLLGARGLAGSPATSSLLFSEAGVVFVLAATLTPIATILVALGLQALDPSLEGAARVAARPLRVVARILLPAAAPAIALAALTVFSLSLSELGVPMFLRVDTFPAAVFARLGGVDYAPGEAFALVLPLVPVVVALLAFERRFVGTRSFAVLGLRSGARERLPLGR
jgi:iron(III) transport system permease protein